MRICDPFREAGWWFRVAERHFELECGCGVTQRADALQVRDDGDVTLYVCAHCGTSVIGVTADERGPVAAGMTATADDEDGHRMCGFVFASRVDMALWPPAAVEPFLDIPARPHFFSARGCD